MKLVEDVDSINLFAVSVAGVNGYTFNDDVARTSIKVFVIKLAKFATVNGIGKICAKSLNVKVLGTSTDFFVRGESKFNFGMRNSWVVK